MQGGRQRLAYQPALDGLRGVAVALVLAFHGGFSWMTGGYVGVSVFFTLSGYLITSLLLAEHDSTSTISLRAFYARRLRRLLPASLVALVGISAAAAAGAFDGLNHLRRDVLAALAQVANWNALHSGTSYADLVARGAGVLGPVDHFWSLAVEEQFYWVWPLACLALLRVRRPRARAATFVGLAALAVATAPVVAHVWGANAAYWATPARLGEILVGAALAVVTSHTVEWPRWVPWAGLVGVGTIVWAATTWPSGSGPAYTGWLGVFALASVAVIAGLQRPGPLRSACSWRPLVLLGRISYGVYVYHWPVFAYVTAHRTGWSLWPLFGLRMAITLALAVVSYVVIEQPIRRGGVLPQRAVVAPLAMAGVALVAVLAVPVPHDVFERAEGAPPATFGPPPSTVAAAGPTSTSPGSTSSAPTTSPGTTSTSTGPGPAGANAASRADPTTVAASTTSTLPPAPVKILMMGDSTAESLSVGMQPWAATAPAPVQVASVAIPGCGLIRKARMFGDDDGSFRKRCDEVLDKDLPAALKSAVPDLVSIMVTLPDSQPRRWSTKEGMIHAADPRFVERLLADDEAMVAQLTAAGVRHIAWIVPPHPGDWWVGMFNGANTTPEDWAAYVGTIDTIAARHPGVVIPIRLDQWLPLVEQDHSWRPDGLHFGEGAAKAVFDRFLGAQLLAAAGAS